MPSYNGKHKRLRAALLPLVESGRAFCVQPICLHTRPGKYHRQTGRWIHPAEPWDLAHNNRGQWIGPAHRDCNRADGARKAASNKGTR